MPHKIKHGLIKQHHSKLLALVRLVDLCVIIVTLWAVLRLQFQEWTEKQTLWVLIAVVGFIVFAEFNELYRENRISALTKEIKNIFLSWGLVIPVLLTADYMGLLIDPLYKQSFTFWVIAVPIEVISYHVIITSIVRSIRKYGRNTRNVAIIGLNPLAREIKTILSQKDWMGLRFVGYFDDRTPDRLKLLDDEKLVGTISELVSKAKNAEVDIIYIVLPMKAESRIHDFLVELGDTTASVYYAPNLFVFDLLQSSVSYFGGIPVVSIYESPFYGVDSVVKRGSDIVLSLIILTLIAPLMAIIALAIKLTSPGDIIFKQRRYGVNGEKIVVWKFRSMTVTEDADKVVQAKKNDMRVTKFGGFLRRTSLDELPQFINVLQGRMSIVGPRPHAVAHNEHYRKQIQGYMLRHKVKPGITGLAQINGFRGETNTLDKMEGRIKYDLEYIRHWSLWLDIKIIMKTIGKGFVGENVY